MRMISAWLLSLLCASAAGAAIEVAPATGSAIGRSLPLHIGGRAVPVAGPHGVLHRRQWPGTYFETAFRGRSVSFAIGAGDVRLHVLVDGQRVATLMKPQPGSYAVTGLGAGDHRLRLEIVSENPDFATVFGGFHAGPDVTPLPLPHRARQIEFIGDSHTVGYGVTASGPACSRDQVWAATDTSAGIAGQLGRRYDADYRVNAISGRGVVRNYNGFAADVVPAAYPYLLLDHQHPDRDAGWRPQVIVVALGTNDFTTPLHAGERWPTRDALHADFEQSYVRFVQQLRARNRPALILLWATDMMNGEIEREVGRVADRLRAAGERRFAYLPVEHLSFAACDDHPSIADDRVIADRIAAAIDRQPGVWRR